MARIRFSDFTDADDKAALALERRCPQGTAFRIAFQRDRFVTRTEMFSTARLICAWDADRLVGIGGGAIKDVTWEGLPTRALMLYDFRIDPDNRREGIARSLALELIEWARPLAEIGYAYALGDNRAIREMARQWIGADAAPAFSLLAHPTNRPAPKDAYISDADPLAVREFYVRTRGETTLECAPGSALTGRQVVGSWQLGDGATAGCTAWTTRGVLEEVVIGLPSAIRAAGQVLRNRQAATIFAAARSGARRSHAIMASGRCTCARRRCSAGNASRGCRKSERIGHRLLSCACRAWNALARRGASQPSEPVRADNQLHDPCAHPGWPTAPACRPDHRSARPVKAGPQ